MGHGSRNRAGQVHADRVEAMHPIFSQHCLKTMGCFTPAIINRF